MLFFSRSQNITEQMRETLSQDNVSVGDEVSEEKRRPRRTRNVPPSGEKPASVPDESMESPVEDSDDDKDYSSVSSTSKDPTTLPITLSTESFFPENNKVQEISIEDDAHKHNFFNFEEENVHENEISQFNDEKFLKFMNNFGSQIKKVLFSDQNYSDFQVSTQQNNKYFSLFEDFQEYKSKLTTTVVPKLSFSTVCWKTRSQSCNEIFIFRQILIRQVFTKN